MPIRTTRFRVALQGTASVPFPNGAVPEPRVGATLANATEGVRYRGGLAMRAPRFRVAL
jgi:hypothetical protein